MNNEIDINNLALNVILSRKSIRSYTKDKVTDKQIDILLKAGMAAPSACDMRPWSFVVCHDAKWANAPCVIVVCGRRTATPAFELDGVWTQDCAAVTENILLAAHSIGLGACWRVCWPSPTVMANIKAQVNLPFGVIPFSYVTIGVPAENPPCKGKYDLELVHYERW